MSPHADNLDRAGFSYDLVDKAVLDINASGVGPREVADKFFVRRRIPERVFLEDGKEGLGLFFKPGSRYLLCVFLGVSGIKKPPLHHLRLLVSFPMGVRRPLRMDSRMPGMERR